MGKICKKVLNLIIISVIAIIIYGNIGTYVKANSIDLGISSSELYSATNTYNYNNELDDSLIPGEENNRLYTMNSVQDRNGNIVSTEEPLLTVLTHGLGGSDYQWSNNGDDELGYASDSIITRMFNSGECNIYVAKYENDTYKLYDITSQMEAAIQADIANGDSLYTVKFVCSNTIDSITDISKHSIVIFDGQSKNYENYKIYREFNYVISRVVYDIKLLNNNKLPRMNLIGHSRGGLTNIEYALDHPDMIASIFSLGTPYCGSSTASV